jgi:hypothetical protein
VCVCVYTCVIYIKQDNDKWFMQNSIHKQFSQSIIMVMKSHLWHASDW